MVLRVSFWARALDDWTQVVAPQISTQLDVPSMRASARVGHWHVTTIPPPTHAVHKVVQNGAGIAITPTSRV